ncbi:MAG UNVERIFIED_CONTAM: hypothetical protein LVR18_19045 [Planctomycetaceae bacterium]
MRFCVTLRPVMVLIFLLGITPTAAHATDSLAGALEASKRGDHAAAMLQLSNLIDNGSQDPRVFLARGLAAEKLEKPTDADFRRAAELEAATGNSSALNLMLENVGGSLREKIENFRFEALRRTQARPRQRKAQRHLSRSARTQANRPARCSPRKTAAADGQRQRSSLLLHARGGARGDRKHRRSCRNVLHGPDPRDESSRHATGE